MSDTMNLKKSYIWHICFSYEQQCAFLTYGTHGQTHKLHMAHMFFLRTTMCLSAFQMSISIIRIVYCKLEWFN